MNAKNEAVCFVFLCEIIFDLITVLPIVMRVVRFERVLTVSDIH